ncbi:MAG TPA: glutamine--fructose-6-phosphate transaminase (isomerizing) [Dehalococcoidia bacterium]|nr:glutamine--fructose-6-phosphate transaminase (isomerizing) [Dehalococcoidia bacterium]
MCGIVGYIGNQQAAPILLNALKKLEYRGYDSAGLATITDSHVCIKKDAGTLVEVNTKHQLNELPGIAGIGHVRWATHGAVTASNAHPHLDCNQEIAIVHNGIIENHQELRSRLSARHRFTSDTDTEVIAHLIEEYASTGSSLEEAVRLTSRELKGSYAIAAVSAKEPGKMVAARKDSPLVAGIANGGNFVASDCLSFLEQTDRIIYVEDGECVILTGDKVSLFDNDGHEIKRTPSKASWKVDEATKQGYDFFMMKEILEQPQAIRHALMQDRTLMMEMALEILRARQVLFTACGTSRHAALIGRYVFSRLSSKFCDVVMASELGYFSDSVDKNTLVIAVSQSGETADVMNGVKKAKENGATIFSLVNVVGSSLARMSDRVAYLNCGPEIGVAATKSFTAQLTILYLLAYTMINRFDQGVGQLNAVSDLIADNLQHNGLEVPKIANRMSRKNDFYYIARGINFATAGEGALKLKEIAYVHAEGMPAGELKHGTLALITEGTPVVAICPGDYTFDETLSNIAETKARGARVIGVSDRQEPAFDEWIEIPEVDEIFYPLVSIIPLQLFAYHSAVARNLDPDKPRNLAKSVTVK